MSTVVGKGMSAWSEHKIRVKQLGKLMPKKYPKLRQGTPDYIKAYNIESEKIKKDRAYWKRAK